MRYNEITTTEADFSYAGRLQRNEKQVIRTLSAQYKTAMAKAFGKFNRLAPSLEMNPISYPGGLEKDEMFAEVVRGIFRVGRSKKDLGKLLTYDEPKDIILQIDKFTEKNFFQKLNTNITKAKGSNVQGTLDTIKSVWDHDFKTVANLKKELSMAPSNLFGAAIEKMINTEGDMAKFYAIIDFVELVLTDMNMRDRWSALKPGNVARSFTDFERQFPTAQPGATSYRGQQ